MKKYVIARQIVLTTNWNVLHVHFFFFFLNFSDFTSITPITHISDSVDYSKQGSTLRAVCLSGTIVANKGVPLTTFT